MTTTTHHSSDLDAAGRLPDELVASFRENGFVRVRGLLERAEVERFGRAADAHLERYRADSLEQSTVFSQFVNVWQRDPELRELSLHPRPARIAEQLTGVPVRVWHDQLLIKEPHSDTATEFHQDRPFWPLAGDRPALSVWVALVDVPPERGCMTFLPGSQRRTGLGPGDFHVADDLFAIDPSLRWSPRVTIPLRAGDCTFHDSNTGHMALPNRTDLARLAHVTIYMDAEMQYAGTPHVVTDPLGLRAGDPLTGDTFPEV